MNKAVKPVTATFVSEVGYYYDWVYVQSRGVVGYLIVKIMLDIDLKTCVKSIILRTVKGYFIKRKDLAEGCEDKFDESKKNLISWTKQFKTAYFPQLIDLCIKYPNVDIKLFRTRKGSREFIERINRRSE